MNEQDKHYMARAQEVLKSAGDAVKLARLCHGTRDGAIKILTRSQPNLKPDDVDGLIDYYWEKTNQEQAKGGAE
ncbi:hypothetical protein [Nitrosomonas sp. ANs5]|uniref:hypothetical protein n=1 Tax=Nitrosomonas sp. ANs5 TaxID=3423941 RepID=UPI003D347EA0